MLSAFSLPLLFCALAEFGAIRITSSNLPAREKDLATFRLRGMKDARDRLRSGVFEARGRLFAKGRTFPDLEVPVDVFCAFDFDADRFRFDCQRPQRIARAKTREGGARRQPEGFSLEDGAAKYARTAKYSVHWSSVDPRHAYYRDPSFEGATHDSPFFDVRTLGLVFRRSVFKSVSFDEICRLLSEQELTEVSDEGPARFRLAWLLGKDNDGQRIVWFREDQGFSPVRLELRLRDRSKGPSTWTNLVEESDVTWMSVNDVWVPKTFSVREKRGGSIVQSLELAFNWKTVNEPVAEELFGARGMELPKKTLVIDTRLGTPVLLGYAGDSDFDLPTSGTTGYGRTVAVALSVGLVVLVGAGAIALHRFRVARKRF